MRSYGQRRSQAQEKRTAKEIGGRVQPGSGSMDFAKGDVRDMGKLRIECKTTGKDRYVLKLADLLKIRLEAVKGGLESWAFQIQFQRSAGMTTRIAVIDHAWFAELGGHTEWLDGADGLSTTIHKHPSNLNMKPHWKAWSLVWRRDGQEHLFAICFWETFLDLYLKAKT